MSGFHEIHTLTEIRTDEQPLHVTAVVRQPWWFFSIDHDVLVYKDGTILSSFKHSSRVVELVVTPDNAIVLFVDERGTLSFLCPIENRGIFSLIELGEIRKVLLIATSLDQFSLFLVTKENILYWNALKTKCLFAAIDGEAPQYFAELFRRVIKLPCSSTSEVTCGLISGTTDVIEVSIPNNLTWLAGSSSPVSEKMRDPFEHLCFQPKFKKSAVIPETGYCLALSVDGLLFLFNLVAEVCLGQIKEFSEILDFSVGPSYLLDELQDGDVMGLPQCELVLLRRTDENDKPLLGDGDSGLRSLVLETFAFPRLERLKAITVEATSWLLSNIDLGALKGSNADRPVHNASGILFAEFIGSECPESDSDIKSKPFVRFRALEIVDVVQGVCHLLKELRFSEARKLVQEYKLTSDVYQKVVVAELRWWVLAFLNSLPDQKPNPTISTRLFNSTVENEQKARQGICDKILICLDELECLRPLHDLIGRFLDVCMPTSAMQMKLFLSLKEKLFADKQLTELEFEQYALKIHAILKRLKAFLLLNGPERFSPSTWKTFLGSNIYTLFAVFLTSDGVSQPNDIPCDPSKAFLLWDLYKSDLVRYLNEETLTLMFETLSHRSLTFTPKPDEEIEMRKMSFIQAETAIQRWLRNELFPVVVQRCPQSIPTIVEFVIGRVQQLELCTSLNETPDRTTPGLPVCPFSWPDFAISWTEGFLKATSLIHNGCETVYRTPGDKVKAFLSGLGSLDPEVDPLSDIRRLTKQLRTIEALRNIYGCRLSLADCNSETELSIAYRILDIPFNLGMSLSNGVDDLTARYLKDRKIDMETFYQGYALDLCRRIQLAVEKYDNVAVSDDNPDSMDTKSDSHTEDPKTLVLHACVVAGWITVPLCRIKVVTKLASLVPFPWPSELMELVDKILKHARDNRLLHTKPITFGRVNNRCPTKYNAHVPQLLRLERLASISRIQEILSRYSLTDVTNANTELDCSVDIARQAVCCLLYNFANPFVGSAVTNNFDFTTPILNEQVLRDSVAIARELVPSEEWSVWFARVRMQMVREMASDLSMLDRTAPDVEYRKQLAFEQRVSFILRQLDESTKYLHDALLGDRSHECRSQDLRLPSYYVIKRFLGMDCLRSIEYDLRLLPSDETDQIALVLEFAVAIAQAILFAEQAEFPQSSCVISVDLVGSSLFSVWLHQHHDDVQYALGVINLVASMRKLTLSSLSRRCHLVQLLTSCWVRCKKANGLCLEYEDSLSLRSAYDRILPDVCRDNREELLAWNWSTASLQSLREMDDNSQLDTSFEGQSSALRITCGLLLDYLRPVVQWSQVKQFRNSYSGQSWVSPLTASHSLSPACSFCMRLWNSPFGRLGCLLQFWHDSMIPMLIEMLTRAGTLAADEFNYVSSIVSQSLHALFLLVFRAVGYWGSKTTSLDKRCTCQIQSLQSHTQGLLQILQAYDEFFAAMTKTCLPALSDPLAHWMFSPMFKETPSVDYLPVQSFTESLSWLSSLFRWLLRPVRQPSDQNSFGSFSSSASETRPSELERLVEGSLDLASSWATQYGSRLRVAVPILCGLHRLICYQSKRDLWTECDTVTPSRSSMRLNSPKLSQNHHARWSLIRTRCLVSALETALGPTEDKYLDQTLVLGLALAVPVEDATIAVRSVVNSIRDAPKKLKAIASIMYVFSLVAPERGSHFSTTSISLAKLWSWKTDLKPYGLNLSHLVARGENEESAAVIFKKLCRIVPARKQQSDSVLLGVLLPSDTTCIDDSSFSKISNASNRTRLLPPVRVLVSFARDFQLPLRDALVNHLRALFASSLGNPVVPMMNQPVPSFHFPGSAGLDDLNMDPFGTKQPEPDIDTLTLCTHHRIVLRRAGLILTRLVAMDCNQPHNDLLIALRGIYNETSSYEYERLQFLLEWIAFISPEPPEPHAMRLLNLLQTYKRISSPTNREREVTSSTLNDDPINFSNSEWNHPFSNTRLPYRELLSGSPPMQIIGNEVTVETLDFWLNVDQVMKWHVGDSLRLLVAKNLISQYDTAGLLPLAHEIGQNTISTTAGWDRALPCQILLRPLFISLQSLLEDVSDHFKVLHFLASLSRQLLYGPHRLALLQLTRDLCTIWLNKLDQCLRSPQPEEHPSWSQNNIVSEIGSFDKYERGPSVQLDQRVQWMHRALERANASYKQLAMEACLYQHHLADWEAVNQKMQNPQELIHSLLSKVASLLVSQNISIGSSASNLPISLLSLRERLSKVLPRLAFLGDLNYPEIASKILLRRLNLPTHILSLRDPEAVDVDFSNQSVLLDASMEQGPLASCDITLNSTVVQSDWPSNPSTVEFTVTEKGDPVEEDFVVAELILRDATVRPELLQNLYSFVFTGDPSAYLVSRWCAARCVLRTQLGFLVWPRISRKEQYDTLLRLALLAECKNPTHQRLIVESSQTQSSSEGGTFTTICVSRLPTVLQQLLISGSNPLQVVDFGMQLIIDFELTEVPNVTILKFLTMVHKHMAKLSTAYLVRLMDYLLLTDILWKCSNQSFMDSASPDNSAVVQFLSDFMHRLFTGATGLTVDPPGQLFNRIFSIILNWPLPDPLFEKAIGKWISLITSATSQITHSHGPTNAVFRLWLLVKALHLLITCSTELSATTFSDCIKQATGFLRGENPMQLTSQAVNGSELCLTAAYMGLSY